MQAWTARRYGAPDTLALEDLPQPKLGKGELLIRVHATTVNSGDVRMRGCDFPPEMRIMGRLALGWKGPRQPVLGTELSGVVEAIGEGVTRFRPGDAVFAFSGMKMAAHAQFAVAKEAMTQPLPAGPDFAQAAALCFGGTTALHYLRKAELKSGQSILVLGGSSCVGLALIQLARQQGAEVAATTSARNIDLVTEKGAHHVIDYTATNLADLPQRFDIIADAVAATDFAAAQKLLKPNGRYLAIAGTLKEMLGAMRKGVNGTRMIAGPAGELPEDIATLARLAEVGHYRPHIDQTFAWADLPKAHAYVETGRKRGSVVVNVAE
ncbi:MAG: NAD(P)-dependent alcohol dehydrogenase [Phyllobacteriaceae bacterium]|nr:NAD(P)-dependent alcohol dehydrogenase [Phyllobacteriaceae bacterium]